MGYIRKMETVIILTLVVLAVMTALILKRSRGVEEGEVEEVSDVYVTDNEHVVADLPNEYDDGRVTEEVDEMRAHESDSTTASYEGGDSGGGDDGGGGGDD